MRGVVPPLPVKVCMNKMKFSKEYIWMLFKIHEEELTPKQRIHVTQFLDSNLERTIDRRWIYATLHRLKRIERGAARRASRI